MGTTLSRSENLQVLRNDPRVVVISLDPKPLNDGIERKHSIWHPGWRSQFEGPN